MSVIQALGESVLGYGVTLYGSCSNSRKSKLDDILHNICRNLPYGTKLDELRTESKMRSLQLLSTERLYIYKILVKNYFNSTFKKPVKKQKV